MTVGELIQKLSEMPQDMIVMQEDIDADCDVQETLDACIDCVEFENENDVNEPKEINVCVLTVR